MATIHPLATVDKRAQIAADVVIGPGCVIDGPAVIGSGCELIGHVYLRGKVELGQGNRLFPYVCVGFEPQDHKYDGTTAGVVIGNENVLRESVTIHCASQDQTPTTLGDHNYLMTNSHVAHDVVVGDHCTLISGALIAGHAKLDHQVTVGGNATVHQFCVLGRLSFIGGLSGISNNLPPFAIISGINTVVGVNVVGLRRSGVPRDAIDAVKAAFKTLYLSGHTNTVSAAMLEQTAAQGGPGAELVSELARFVRDSQRGLCPHVSQAAKHRLQR